MVLSLSRLFFSVAMSHSEGSVRAGRCNVECRLFFVGRVLDALRGREHKNADRRLDGFV